MIVFDVLKEAFIDVRTRLKALRSACNSKDFIISNFFLLLFSIYYLFSIGDYLGDVGYVLDILLMLISPIIILVILYDIILSYIVFNIQIFSLGSSSKGYISNIISGFISPLLNIDNETLKSGAESEIEEVTNKVVKRILLQMKKIINKTSVFSDNLTTKIISQVAKLVKGVIIEKDYNGFPNKMSSLFTWMLFKLEAIVVTFLRIVFEIILKILKSLPFLLLILFIFAVFVVFYTDLSDGLFPSSINFFELANIIETASTFITIVVLVLTIYYIVKFLQILGSLPEEFQKYFRMAIILLITYAVYSIILSPIFIFIVDKIQYLDLYIFESITNNSSVQNEDISSSLVSIILVSIFLFLKSYSPFFRLVSYFYAAIISISLLTMSFMGSYVIIYIGILYTWLMLILSIQRRLSLRIIYSAFVISISYIGDLSIQEASVIQMLIVMFLIITDYKIVKSVEKEEIFNENDLYIKSLQGKYKTILNKVRYVKKVG